MSAFLFALKELDILDIKFTPTFVDVVDGKNISFYKSFYIDANFLSSTSSTHPVDKVTVNADGSVVFHFKNDSDIILKI